MHGLLEEVVDTIEAGGDGLIVEGGRRNQDEGQEGLSSKAGDEIRIMPLDAVLIMRHHNSEAIHASEYESLTSLAEIVLLSGELRRISNSLATAESIPRVWLWEERETKLLEDCINFNKLSA
ncbi:hypothetical protein RHGRI_008248 [Rhododendron griersonianum]|uniref:Uncharacterized protein n=1 Tax=Rhododendron griersonianum TaxID=479676 RepID=A0AAV6KZN5_9ERIC|nr:hypothetical protein RHGRI_008248 [Rhododendron griersonianum]